MSDSTRRPDEPQAPLPIELDPFELDWPWPTRPTQADPAGSPPAEASLRELPPPPPPPYR